MEYLLKNNYILRLKWATADFRTVLLLFFLPGYNIFDSGRLQRIYMCLLIEVLYFSGGAFSIGQLAEPRKGGLLLMTCLGKLHRMTLNRIRS